MSRFSRQLPYWTRPGEWEAEAREPEPREDALHGWTLAEIHDLARSAARANKWLVSDFTVRYEAAWDGIVDELLAATSRPQAHDLARAGKGAVSRTLLKDFCHTYGVADRDLSAGIGSAPRFAAYWAGQPDEPFDERIVERIALGQVMEAIGPRHVGFLNALAAAADTRSAAEALGIPRASYRLYMTQARRAFEALWYSPEAPPSGRRRAARYAPSAANEARKAACGTWIAHERHRRRGDECADPDGCRAAYIAHESARKQKRRAA